MAKHGPTFFAKALSRYFFEYLPSERGLSQETIRSYRDAISLLLDFCEQERQIRRDKLEVSDFNRELIEAFYGGWNMRKATLFQRETSGAQLSMLSLSSCSTKIRVVYCFANRFGKSLQRNANKEWSLIFRKKPSKLFLNSPTLQCVRDGETLPF